jgi:hypothetical protein
MLTNATKDCHPAPIATPKTINGQSMNETTACVGVGVVSENFINARCRF